jgi:hypothetical protein
MKRSLPLLAAALALAGPATAQLLDPINPDRPGFSTGASTVGNGVLQVEFGGNEFWGGGDPGFFTLPLAVRYGVGRTTELRLESDTLSIQDGEHGFGDLFAGVKWTLHDADPVLGVMARLRLPSGSRAFRQDGVTPDVTLLADLPLGEDWTLEPNIMLAIPRDAGGDGRLAQWTYAVTATRNVTPKLQAFAELASLGPSFKDGPRQGFADAGVAYALDEDRVLDLDVMVGLSDAAPDWGITGGITIRF